LNQAYLGLALPYEGLVMLDFVLSHGVIWTAAVELPLWAGFQSRGRAYGAQGDEASWGLVTLFLDRAGNDLSQPNAVELRRAEWFLAEQAAQQQALIAGLLAEWPVIRRDYLQTYGEELTPEVASSDDLRGLMGLHSVHLHEIEAGGLPYVGYELGCTWAEEHGLGILMHGQRVVKIGSADIAFETEFAAADAAKAR
jgi:hypothetical protein